MPVSKIVQDSIDSSQALATVGIKFPASQSASADANTLDDYEEGTWTLTVTGSTSGEASYNFRLGQYVKIGKCVSIYGYYNIQKNTLSGNLRLSLPFPVANISGGYASVLISYWDDLATNVVNLQGYADGGASFFTIGKLTAAAANLNSRLNDTDINNSHELMFSATYFV